MKSRESFHPVNGPAREAPVGGFERTSRPSRASGDTGKAAQAKSQERPGALFLLGSDNLDLIYSPAVRQEISRLTRIVGPPQTRESIQSARDLLAETEVIFSGWGGPVFDQAFLERAPKLRAVFYGSGSVRPFVTDAFWDCGIVITSAWAANAVPVAEYTVGAILLSLRHFWKYAAHAKAGGAWEDHRRKIPGSYLTTVGIVSFGMIARRVVERLESFELRRLVYCPFLTGEAAADLDMELCGLEEIFTRSDVVTIHTPVLPETIGLITGDHIARMKPGATLINTARGSIIRETEMIEVLRARPDLTAILDVTEPEPPPPDSPLFELPNVIVTPHIAGSHHHECRRMGDYMLEEFRRYLAGTPLKWQITREMNQAMA